MNDIIKIIIYTSITIFFLNDIVLDFLANELDLHFYLELLFTILILYLLFSQIYEIRSTRKKLSNAKIKIHNLQGEMIKYINISFNKWGLTKAENDIAWLIIKGFSFKEIANIRKVTQKTISQQTSSIYKKSNTNSRFELMSLFLEEFIA